MVLRRAGLRARGSIAALLRPHRSRGFVARRRLSTGCSDVSISTHPRAITSPRMPSNSQVTHTAAGPENVSGSDLPPGTSGRAARLERLRARSIRGFGGGERLRDEDRVAGVRAIIDREHELRTWLAAPVARLMGIPVRLPTPSSGTTVAAQSRQIPQRRLAMHRVDVAQLVITGMVATRGAPERGENSVARFGHAGSSLVLGRGHAARDQALRVAPCAAT